MSSEDKTHIITCISLYNKNMAILHRRSRKVFTPLRIALICFLAGVVVLTTLELTNTTHIFTKETNTGSSNIPAESPNESIIDSNENDQNDTQSPTDSGNSMPQSDKNNTPQTSGAELIAPFGNFISSHSLSLSDPYAANQESVCNTTPSASCKIEFKKNEITKTLEPKKADSNGSVVWNWNPEKAGLTEGSWQIIVTAQLGNDTKITTDTVTLEVTR